MEQNRAQRADSGSKNTNFRKCLHLRILLKHVTNRHMGIGLGSRLKHQLGRFYLRRKQGLFEFPAD